MSARPLTPGTPAPDFALAATTSGREVRPGSGRPLVLVFHAQNAAFAVDRLNREVRERHPSPGELTVASVVDLSLVPPFFRPSARMALDMSYRQAAASLQRDADPADYVVYPWRTGPAGSPATTTRAAHTSSPSWSPSRGTGRCSAATLARTSPRRRSSCCKRPHTQERVAQPRRGAYTQSPTRGRSSVGRAPPLHGGGRGFESPRLHSKKCPFCGQSTDQTKSLRVCSERIYCNRTATRALW